MSVLLVLGWLALGCAAVAVGLRAGFALAAEPLVPLALLGRGPTAFVLLTGRVAVIAALIAGVILPWIGIGLLVAIGRGWLVVLPDHFV